MSGITRAVALAALFLFATISLGVAAPQQPSRLSDQQLKDLLSRIHTRTETFRGSLERAIDRSQINGSQTEDRIDQAVKDFEQASNRLRDRVNDGRSSTADVEEVVRRASIVDNFMAANQLEAATQRDWQTLRLDVDGLARAYGVAGSWARTGNGARADDQQVKQLLTRIRKEADQFRGSLDKALDRSRLHGSREENSINQSAQDFAKATDRLRSRFGNRQTVTSDVDDVLQRGGSIDRFMLTQRGQLEVKAENDWGLVRRDLDGLARAYGVAWNWSEHGDVPGQPGASLSRRLTGTYHLDNTRGDDPRQAAEQAARAMTSDWRQPTYQRLMNRLTAPEAIAIARHGNNVSMESSRGPRVTFEADGRTRTEQGSGGRTIETSASLDGDRLVVTTNGDRRNDFTVTFEPMDDDRAMRVTRRIHDEDLSEPVTVRSYYRRSSNEARWDIYSPGDRDTSSNTYTTNRDFLVPNGTRLVATLDEALSTETAREGDRVTMTARSPSEYEGAVLEGIVSGVNASGRVSGRADLTLDFQSIRVRSGRTYPFGGVIENVRTPSGETIRVGREGTVEANDSQTDTTIQRSALGAALGAIIGAVAGGGKGAAIGAVVGAGGGASTVLVQGRDQLDLQRGTEVTITSSAASGQGVSSGGPR